MLIINDQAMAMVHSRFTIQSLFLLTAGIASGFGLMRAADGGGFLFCLGAVTVYIAAGLVQQVIAPLRPDSPRHGAARIRILCVCTMLSCLGLAVFRFLASLATPVPNDSGKEYEAVVGSTIALPLWVLTLLLGSLTSLSWSRCSESTRNAFSLWGRRIISALVSFALLFYICCLAANWTLVPALVDIAIHGVKVGIHQGPAAETSLYVHWFGRNPQQFERFLRYQLYTWPLLALSLFFASGASQSLHRNRRQVVSILGVVAVLALPAVFNAVWLISGGARQIFPELVQTYWSVNRSEIALTVLPLVLLTLYLTTRRVHLPNLLPAELDKRTLCCDHLAVGWLFIAMGCFGFMDTLRAMYYVDSFSDFEAFPTWIEATQMVPQVIADFLSSPEYAYPAFLFPYGVSWLWRQRQRQSQSSSVARWPQFGTHHLLYFPVILMLLTASIILIIPFGIALWHFQL